MTEIDAIRKTSGLSSGYLTPTEVLSKFGVDIRMWPGLFSVTRTGLVCKLPRHEQLFKNHINNVKLDFNSLGIR